MNKAIGKMLFDPKKTTILSIVAKEEKTVKEIAKILGESPSRLYYHINQLEESGLLQVAREKMVKNITQKYYIASELFETEFTFDGQLDSQDKDFILGSVQAFTTEAIRRVGNDLENSSEEKHTEVSVASLNLSQSEWKELNKKIRQLIANAVEESNDADEKNRYKYILMSYCEE